MLLVCPLLNFHLRNSTRVSMMDLQEFWSLDWVIIVVIDVGLRNPSKSVLEVKNN